MNYTNHRKLCECALGNKPATLVLKNAKIIDVFTETINEGDIAIEQGTIVGVGIYTGETEIDLQGKYVCPGFFDAHLHLESTLAAPGDLVSAAVKQGTTTFIVDPHEVANVAGTNGIDYIIDQTEEVSANVFVMMPSCVPVNQQEENGHSIKAEDMKPYLQNRRVLGLGEVMDYTSVIQSEEEMLKKLDLFKNRIKDGHAPGLTSYQLAAYALSNIKTDHECTDYDYAMQEIRNGMYVLIREGSGAKNLEAIVRGIVSHNTDISRFAFCTDDKHISDIEQEGHISFNVRKSIELGLDPIKAIKMATINPANCYGFDDLGAIAPGYQADLIVFDELSNIKIHEVYYKGKRIDSTKSEKKFCPASLKKTIHVDTINEEKLSLALSSAETTVIEIVKDQILTKQLIAKVPMEHGFFVPNEVYNKVVVIERHRNTGHVGVAPVVGFSLRNGAIGTTVSHDSHNIVIVGDSDTAILLALKELQRTQGGYTMIENGKPYDTLPLPIMGIMTDAPSEEIEEKLHRMIQKAHDMGVPSQVNPFITLSFMALPVIAEIRVTTKGLFHVETQKFL